MATSKIIYKGNLRTEAVHLNSGNIIITDAPIDNQGKGEAFSPTDLVAAALGSCMLTIIGIKAREIQIDIDGVEIEITKVMASDPRRIDEILVDFNFHHILLSEKERIIIERAARTCPVALSLNENLKQTINFNF